MSGRPGLAAAHRTLSAMLGYAIDEGLIVRNVAEAVDIPRQAPSERDSLTRTEPPALLALGGPQWTLAPLSAARDGEIRALRRSDVDLEAGRLTIHLLDDGGSRLQARGALTPAGRAAAARTALVASLM